MLRIRPYRPYFRHRSAGAPALPGALLAVAVLAALAALVGGAVGCGGSGGGGEDRAAGEGERPAPPEPATATYEVRGEVTAVPAADEPAAELILRHEAIDGFTDIDGDVVGMSAMTMPFPLAPGISAAGLAPGDRVRFTLEVTWYDDPPYRITALEPLPEGTELEFRRAQPDG